MENCANCSHWKAVSDAEGCSEGVCRNISHSSWHGSWQLTDAANSCEQWSEIVYYQGEDGESHVERRVAERAQVDFPARLQTPGGTRNARLADLSETGARVLVSDPPKAGIVALIQIGKREMFCRVAWSRDGSCGIAFEKPLPSELVAAITGKVPVQPILSGNPTRNPLARKPFGLRSVA